MMDAVHYTWVRNGQFTSRELRNRMLQDGPVEVILRERRRYPGPKANAYYRGVLVPAITAAIQDAGNDATERDVHEYLCRRFLRSASYSPELDGYELFTSNLSRLTSSEFSAFVAKVEQWAVEFWSLRLPERPAAIS